eukprot:5722208-Prymnesium_polylepis.1
MTYITIISKIQNGPTLEVGSSPQRLVALSSALNQAGNQPVAGENGIMRTEPCRQIRHACSYGRC